MHMGELAGKGKMTYPQGRGWYDGEHRYALILILPIYAVKHSNF
jgi:hypothetical protein